jgi:hypothetical protein
MLNEGAAEAIALVPLELRNYLRHWERMKQNEVVRET